jgi:hypothetical protein
LNDKTMRAISGDSPSGRLSRFFEIALPVVFLE